MLSLNSLQEFLIVSIALSTITCAFVQKTKKFFKKSSYLIIYSFFINMLLGTVFCISFTDISFPMSLWIGLFSFIGADTIYKSLEGKLSSHTDIINSRKILIDKNNIIREENNKNGKTSIPK